MSLPAWTDDRVLPPGAWPTDLDGIYERFVKDAPHQEKRELLFSLLKVYLEMIRPLVGPAKIWIDGGFSTCKITPPGDVDIAIFPDDFSHLDRLSPEESEQLIACVTHQGVTSDVIGNNPFPRLQPMAGMLDAFLAAPEQHEYWDRTWSRVKFEDTVVEELTKGYAEVRI